MAESKKDRHDESNENGYKKRCYCEKCVKSFDEWCDVKKHEGKPLCRKKSYTICEIVCERTDSKTYFYGHKKEFEGKWEGAKAYKPDCHDKKDYDDKKDRHDEHDENGYKKRCRCQKCKKTYDEWCKDKADQGKTVCRRKCYTIVEYVCEKTDVYKHTFGKKKRYEGKWEEAKPFQPPKHCDDKKDHDDDDHKEDKKEKKDRKKDHKKDDCYHSKSE